MSNKLHNATSPYLLQHAHNPVHWYPWGEEALSRAKKEQKPIFLSIGYSACHWCHVMERESFENHTIANVLNDSFISIKVDREQRPDIDEIYMHAVQMLTGSGGWPLSVFLTPEGEPFYGGTYFPPENRHGQIGFTSLITQLATAWRDDRQKILQAGRDIRGQMQLQVASSDDLPPATVVQGALGSLHRSFDPINGGFSHKPKFPSAAAIALLLQSDNHHQQMALHSLTQMARGGIYDQLGGGFHRYSVDERWLVPHFEKMLYDNAQLVPLYASAYQLTGDSFYKRIVIETLEYQLREMSDPAGGFYSTEDADSDGQEGAFYLWDYNELAVLLGSNAERFCKLYTVKPEGNFSSPESYHRRLNILHLSEGGDETAIEHLANQRRKLRALRDKRLRPDRDDKILTAWNGMMISAMLSGYRITDDKHYLRAAQRAASFIQTRCTNDGQLMRSHRQGISETPAFLDDYAALAVALIDLYLADFDTTHLDDAEGYIKIILRDFAAADGAFFYSANATELITRSIPLYDTSEPSGNSLAAEALLRMAHLRENKNYRHAAEGIFNRASKLMQKSPQAIYKLIEVYNRYYLNAADEIVVITAHDETLRAEITELLSRRYLPHTTLIFSHKGDDPATPFSTGRHAIDTKATLYYCHNSSCRAPVVGRDKIMHFLHNL